jgi:hypothetical protein
MPMCNDDRSEPLLSCLDYTQEKVLAVTVSVNEWIGWPNNPTCKLCGVEPKAPTLSARLPLYQENMDNIIVQNWCRIFQTYKSLARTENYHKKRSLHGIMI